MAKGNNQQNNSNNQNQAQPKGKPKCGTCGKFHNGRLYCFPSRLRVGRFTNNQLGM